MSEEKRILQCLNCGQPFEPTCHITRQKFCCDACRHKYNNVKRHYDVPVKFARAVEISWSRAGAAKAVLQ